MLQQKKLPDKYDAKTRKECEKFWQNYWQQKEIFSWKDDLPKEQTFVIDTPPPTVSGFLHMGHVFSYTQADFIARFHRMNGKDVFYPMGFDDNGLPTERLVEKITGKKAAIYEAQNGPGSFVKKCREVVEEAEKEFEALFGEIALSVDWQQKYQTISPWSQKISQASFIDLYNKGLIERRLEPVFWDISDRTALAQADLADKETEGMMNYIRFEVCSPDLKDIKGISEKPSFSDVAEITQDIVIMTTRPELLPACVAVMIHPDDERYKDYIRKPLNQEGEGFTGCYALTALFNVKVPVIADKLVQKDKGSGAVMCCTFGDETDIKWWKKYKKLTDRTELETRIILNKEGKIDKQAFYAIFAQHPDIKFVTEFVAEFYGSKKADPTIKEAREIIIRLLKNPDFLFSQRKSDNHSCALLLKQEPVTRSVKCSERSGVPIEILVMPQWFIKILDKKELLKAKAGECNWFPNYMKIRLEQWIEGLSWDWCISRQRFFGVKFPLWYVKKENDLGAEEIIIAAFDQLPLDPALVKPPGYENYEASDLRNKDGEPCYYTAAKNGERYIIRPETDIMDTWATSSLTPQLSSGAVNSEINFGNFERHKKLFPADLRPQAHEIIRSWAFYTLVKATLHQDCVPWQNLMISGWCLAADKTKMSKSKGNVITPTALIEEKGSDIVRYWASTSHPGADTAYNEETFKIGQKLITKLFNAAKFTEMSLAGLGDAEPKQTTKNDDIIHDITQAADLWILARLYQTMEFATGEFEKFEYARARQVIEEFFWQDFCDNYLEICKVRSYGLKAEKLAGVILSDFDKSEIRAKQKSAILTLKICLNIVLKLFAPFIPHLCEEIYAAIFAAEFEQTTSIHARGNWPKLEEYAGFSSTALINSGKNMLAVIYAVRKFKSEKNLSMKEKVSEVKITINGNEDLEPFLADLADVCNAGNVNLAEQKKLVEVIL